MSVENVAGYVTKALVSVLEREDSTELMQERIFLCACL